MTDNKNDPSTKPENQENLKELNEKSSDVNSSSYTSLKEKLNNLTNEVKENVALNNNQVLQQSSSLEKHPEAENLKKDLNSMPNDEIDNSGGVAPSLLKGKKIKKAVFISLGLILFAVLVLIALKFKSPGVSSLLGNKGEIVWWGVQHDSVVYESLIEEFEKENPNIKIRYEKQSTEDYRKRLNNALVSGKGPDIFEIHNSWPAMFKEELSSLPTSVMSNDEFKNAFYPLIVSNLTYDGKVIAMPLEYDAITLFINEDVFTSALKSTPQTWTELRDLSKELTQKDNRGVIIQSGVALGITKNVDYWPEILCLMMFQNRVNPAKPTSNLAGEVLSFYKQFSKNDVWDDTLPRSTNAFAKGKLAMYFGPIRSVPEILKEKPDFNFKTVPLPQLPKNNPSDPDYSYATYWVQGVSEKSKNKEASWNFLKFMASSDSLKKISQNLKKNEGIERPFPRPEMNISFREDSVLSSVVSLALDAKTWYLAYGTYDGTDGINSQVNKIYEDIITKWSGNNPKLLTKTSQDISQLFSKYSISTR